MTIDDLLAEYDSGLDFQKKTGMSRRSFTYWKKNGCIPIGSQYRLEKITQGRLVADPMEEKKAAVDELAPYKKVLREIFSDNPMALREHRGGLKNSLDTLVGMKDFESLKKHVEEILDNWHIKVPAEEICFSEMAVLDTRINRWTRYVEVKVTADYCPTGIFVFGMVSFKNKKECDKWK